MVHSIHTCPHTSRTTSTCAPQTFVFSRCMMWEGKPCTRLPCPGCCHMLIGCTTSTCPLLQCLFLPTATEWDCHEEVPPLSEQGLWIWGMCACCVCLTPHPPPTPPPHTAVLRISKSKCTYVTSCVRCWHSVCMLDCDRRVVAGGSCGSVAEQLAQYANGPGFDSRQLHLSFLLFHYFQRSLNVMAWLSL